MTDPLISLRREADINKIMLNRGLFEEEIIEERKDAEEFQGIKLPFLFKQRQVQQT